MRICPECGKEFTGRTDKKFCPIYCKSAFHYQKNRTDEENLFKQIDDQLKLNRKILKKYNRGGKATVRKELLLAEGFNPKYFTHYWRNSRGDVYLFCYEYGFLERREKDRLKYVLVRWQTYMKHS